MIEDTRRTGAISPQDAGKPTWRQVAEAIEAHGKEHPSVATRTLWPDYDPSTYKTQPDGRRVPDVIISLNVLARTELTLFGDGALAVTEYEEQTWQHDEFHRNPPTQRLITDPSERDTYLSRQGLDANLQHIPSTPASTSM